jgi:hypothetical protein
MNVDTIVSLLFYCVLKRCCVDCRLTLNIPLSTVLKCCDPSDSVLYVAIAVLNFVITEQTEADGLAPWRNFTELKAYASDNRI